jgi:hypothetical protein
VFLISTKVFLCCIYLLHCICYMYWNTILIFMLGIRHFCFIKLYLLFNLWFVICKYHSVNSNRIGWRKGTDLGNSLWEISQFTCFLCCTEGFQVVVTLFIYFCFWSLIQKLIVSIDVLSVSLMFSSSSFMVSSLTFSCILNWFLYMARNRVIASLLHVDI